jgi:N-acetylmuramoyl-L-alanine amidase
MYGHEFLDLRAWGAAQGLKLNWDPRTKALVMTNRSIRLEGAESSRLLEVNGVRTWLSVPLTQRDQGLYVARLDVRTLLEPLLRPVRLQGGRKVRVVALDPGHGGEDPGNSGGGHQEKTQVLLLAKKVRLLLQQAGLKVVLTRSSDVFVDLDERVALAKRARADLFVSLHYNGAGAGNHDAKGIEVFCTTPAGVQSTNTRPDEPGSTRAVLGNLANARSVLLAYQLQKALVGALDAEDRGVRRARFAVLRNSEMPSVLIEGGFLSAPDEARQIVEVGRRNKLAGAIADGVLAYKRLVERK